MKEAAGVCGGRGQAMEKVRECGLKLSREDSPPDQRNAPQKAVSVAAAALVNKVVFEDKVSEPLQSGIGTWHCIVIPKS